MAVLFMRQSYGAFMMQIQKSDRDRRELPFKLSLHPFPWKLEVDEILYPFRLGQLTIKQ